jgi:hypothetical protein
VRLVELESNHKLLYSDNCFPLVPGKDKIIELSRSGFTCNREKHEKKTTAKEGKRVFSYQNLRVRES